MNVKMLVTDQQAYSHSSNKTHRLIIVIRHVLCSYKIQQTIMFTKNVKQYINYYKQQTTKMSHCLSNCSNSRLSVWSNIV